MDKKARRATLRNFLKECRARLSPEDVGIATTGRRRVPGLRREEVAELSGISLAWYTQLETARDIRVSTRLIDRLAAVLRLSDDEKMQLFSLAIDELPVLPRATPDSIGAIGHEYFELNRFTRRARSASSILELGELTTDLLYDLERPVADAYFICADLDTRQFRFLTQRNAPDFAPVPSIEFPFSAVDDANDVLVDGGLSVAPNVAKRHHLIFAPRASEFGAGRFISKGVHAPSLDGAIGYFQISAEDFSERDSELLALLSEIVYLALAAHV
ncbi:MAG TPA: transcriptional regulator [Verrucomicrobiae bacterium]|nr:transcriptional regulator [Verrucomicrobiae bacterium]